MLEAQQALRPPVIDNLPLTRLAIDSAEEDYLPHNVVPFRVGLTSVERALGIAHASQIPSCALEDAERSKHKWRPQDFAPLPRVVTPKYIANQIKELIVDNARGEWVDKKAKNANKAKITHSTDGNPYNQRRAAFIDILHCWTMDPVTQRHVKKDPELAAQIYWYYKALNADEFTRFLSTDMHLAWSYWLGFQVMHNLVPQQYPKIPFNEIAQDFGLPLVVSEPMQVAA